MRLQAQKLFGALTDRLVPAEIRNDPEQLRQAHRLVAFQLAMLFWVPVFVAVYCALDAPISALVVLSGGALIVFDMALLRRGLSPARCGDVLTGAAWYVYTTLAVFTGGIFAPVMVWYASVPVLSMLLAGIRSAKFWSLASGLAICGLAVANFRQADLPQEITPAGMLFLQFSGLMGLIACVYSLVSLLRSTEHRARQALHLANCQLELQAATDGLTGIANRQSFDRVFQREWMRHQRMERPMTVALLDADFFKVFNDYSGHLAGDECLRAIARTLQTNLGRPGDFVARFGGEEFAMILADTNPAGALQVAESMRQAVRNLAIPHPQSPVGPFVTISVGLATAIPARDQNCLELLHEADMALYRAKTEGRDRTILATPLHVELV